jgi:hypothetical protein
MEEAKGDGGEATLGVNATDMQQTDSAAFLAVVRPCGIALATNGLGEC